VTRAVTQPLLYGATGLPEGARYFGFVIQGPPPALDAPASTAPSSRALVYVADLVGEPREFGGREWRPVPGAPAEVLELIDGHTGRLLTIVRAAFLPAGSRAQPDDAGDAATPRSSSAPGDPPDDHQVPPGAPVGETNAAAPSRIGARRRVGGHRTGPSGRRTRHGLRPRARSPAAPPCAPPVLPDRNRLIQASEPGS